MKFAPLEKIADAVLYEGYILYPYRASALKNRQRWNFGTLYPRAFAETQSPPELFSFQAEVLIAGNPESRVTACLRFLQLLPAGQEDPHEWNRGVPRSQIVEDIALAHLADSRAFTFDFCPANHPGATAAPLVAQLGIRTERLRERLWRLRATLANETPLPDPGHASATSALQSACVSAHLFLGVENAEFISLLEPPSEYQADVAGCANRGVFPVLAGDSGDRSTMLCSPIILYDYPQIAPESGGDFFDGTEMDEMLALRVLTLTDEEKAEIRAGDPQAAAILERTETLPGEHLLKLHGAVRGLRPASPEDHAQSAVIDPWNPFEEHPPLQSVRVFGVEVRCGDRVRLWPARKADILDIAMNGKVAMVEAIEQDLEGKIQFAVVLEDDPGKDMGLLRQAAHRFFFTPEEIEPLSMGVS
jgi:hypothetical protein